jgi:hypothetical protein
MRIKTYVTCFRKPKSNAMMEQLVAGIQNVTRTVSLHGNDSSLVAALYNLCSLDFFLLHTPQYCTTRIPKTAADVFRVV